MPLRDRVDRRLVGRGGGNICDATDAGVEALLEAGSMEETGVSEKGDPVLFIEGVAGVWDS